MTDTKNEPCRVMAEQLWLAAAMPTFGKGNDKYKKEWINGTTDAIRTHTIVPEMVRLCRSVVMIKDYNEIGKYNLIARATAILAKLEGKKP